jgi:hypothetical protein
VTGFGGSFLEFLLGVPFRGMTCDGLVWEFFFLFFCYFFFFFFGLFPELLSLVTLLACGS